MGFGPGAGPSGIGHGPRSKGPRDGGPPGEPPGIGPPAKPPAGGPPGVPPGGNLGDRGPPGGPPGGDPINEPPELGIPENIWRWIVYVNRKIWNVVRRLQRTQDTSEGLRRIGSNLPTHLELGTDDSWGPRPSRSPRALHPWQCPTERSHTPAARGEEERDKWLSADYRRHRDPFCSAFQPKPPVTPWSQPHRRMPDPERCRMRSPKRTWSGISKVPMETPF